MKDLPQMLLVLFVHGGTYYGNSLFCSISLLSLSLSLNPHGEAPHLMLSREPTSKTFAFSAQVQGITMPESRDRLSRPVDVAAILFAPRRYQGGILIDEPEREPNLFGTPIRPQRTTTTTTTMTPVARTPAGFEVTRGGGGGLGRGSFGTPRTGNLRRENTPIGTSRRTRGRGGRNSILPSWYPRTPLRDITAIVRAIERRRASLREVEGLEIGSPTPQELGIPVPSPSVLVAPLEHNLSTTTPRSAVRTKPCPLSVSSVGKVPKILLGIANQRTEESECLTPQKKLLNSIDTVEKEVMEELHKLKRTPTAKKAEREKRVRTLMSMR